ncbi:hypothetical protein ACIDI_19c00040 [Acidiphilium sp. JA12-A1]|jgi:hypothetical protein|nr:hypothetical protein ACIDI_19c00040 [Acidiphilium sp. JA12-A1]
MMREAQQKFRSPAESGARRARGAPEPAALLPGR